MEQLKKGLSATDAIAVVAGTMIGTGVFLKASIMASQVGSANWVLVAWVVAGFMSLLGALVYAEMGGMFQSTGGEYIYLKESWGNLPAYLFGWMRFWITGPGTIAAYAVGSATFLEGAWKWEIENGRIILSIIFIVALSLTNCLSVSVGGTIQTIMTVLKALIMVVLAFLLIQHGQNYIATEISNGTFTFTWSGFGAAVLAALWAYDGWNNLPMMAAEVKDSSKSVPRALIIGVGFVIALYLFINWAYFYALPLAQVMSANSSNNPDALPIATVAAIEVMGPIATAILSIVFAVSALGAMNGSVMTGARVPYALSKDEFFPKFLSKLNEKAKVPYVSVLSQGLLGSILAVLGSFDQLTDYVIFASWISYALVAAGVIRLRIKKPELPRPYKVPLYPILPITFVALSILLLGNTLITSPNESMIGLGLILTGIPVYYFKSRKKKQ